MNPLPKVRLKKAGLAVAPPVYNAEDIAALIRQVASDMGTLDLSAYADSIEEINEGKVLLTLFGQLASLSHNPRAFRVLGGPLYFSERLNFAAVLGELIIGLDLPWHPNSEIAYLCQEALTKKVGSSATSRIAAFLSKQRPGRLLDLEEKEFFDSSFRTSIVEPGPDPRDGTYSTFPIAFGKYPEKTRKALRRVLVSYNAKLIHERIPLFIRLLEWGENCCLLVSFGILYTKSVTQVKPSVHVSFAVRNIHPLSILSVEQIKRHIQPYVCISKGSIAQTLIPRVNEEYAPGEVFQNPTAFNLSLSSMHAGSLIYEFPNATDDQMERFGVTTQEIIEVMAKKDEDVRFIHPRHETFDPYRIYPLLPKMIQDLKILSRKVICTDESVTIPASATEA